jgi:pyrroloquinoline quinone (PQQ) biosynthesis protein C
MNTSLRQYGVRRVYETTPHEDGSFALRLSDRVVDLGKREHDLYSKIVEWLPSTRDAAQLQAELGSAIKDEQASLRLFETLKESGLLYDRSKIPASLTGTEFHRDHFTPALASWLSEAFAHPFWERMMSGKGSARLFSGWMIELYHYTLNANRHMSLSVAHCNEKPLKTLRAKHYAEEWNHYHYFMKSLKALGFTEAEIKDSVPLPMTLALSNFMRQAAREDILCYSICSAVLEGTTTDRGTYNPYYEKSAELYGVPKAAIAPIYAHLDLDIKYGHSDLFADMLKHVDKIDADRASRILDYGHQLVEHIWLWTDNIEKYYDVEGNAVPRRQFHPFLD